jgi:phosphatidylserine/phosphatidylglycerophosphate/cardiolipin synthase-like enzyme
MEIMRTTLVLLLALGVGGDPKEPAEVVFAPSGKDRALQKRVAREIGGAKKKVVAAIYQFTSKEIAQALVAAKNRGVDVRVLVDGPQAAALRSGWAEALEMVEAAKVPVRRVYADGDKKSRSTDAGRAKFHHKFVVIDGERVLTGSFNWTVLADEENYENLVTMTGKVAVKYAEEFDRVWKDERVAE